MSWIDSISEKPVESWVKSIQDFNKASWLDSNKAESYPSLPACPVLFRSTRLPLYTHSLTTPL